MQSMAMMATWRPRDRDDVERARRRTEFFDAIGEPLPVPQHDRLMNARDFLELHNVADQQLSRALAGRVARSRALMLSQTGRQRSQHEDRNPGGKHFGMPAQNAPNTETGMLPETLPLKHP